MPTVILVSGVPTTWKSSYCRWLEREKGFLHLDVERPGVLQSAGLEESWNRLFAPRSTAIPLLRELCRFGRMVVIDWGFPPAWLQVVRALKNAGVAIWWFNAERTVAREKLIEREGNNAEALKAFERQMNAIEENWPEIRKVFSSHIIETLHLDRTYTPPQEISRRMFPSRKE